MLQQSVCRRPRAKIQRNFRSKIAPFKINLKNAVIFTNTSATNKTSEVVNKISENANTEQHDVNLKRPAKPRTDNGKLHIKANKPGEHDPFTAAVETTGYRKF